MSLPAATTLGASVTSAHVNRRMWNYIDKMECQSVSEEHVWRLHMTIFHQDSVFMSGYGSYQALIFTRIMLNAIALE